MDKKIQQGLQWFEKEMKKDQKEIEIQNKKMIDEVKTFDKSKIFVEKQKNKVSIIDKLLMIFGYGKKR